MKKFKQTILILISIFILTGCTSYKQFDKKAIADEETGQKIVDNILCRTDQTNIQYEKIKQKEIEKLKTGLESNSISNEDYEKKLEEVNKLFNIDNIVGCSEFTMFNGESTGLWTTLFVKSLSWLIITIGEFTKNYGWAIIIVTLLIRLALYPLTNKTAQQSENMKQAQPKLTKLEEKYRNKNDRDTQMMKSQEMMKIYKDYKISPFSGCLFALIQVPLFFAFYEALYRLPVVLEGNFFGINLGLTPLTAFKLGNYYYLIFIVLVVAATYFSFKLNATASMSSEQAKQMKMMSNISIIMISIASFTISTGIALYWIVNSTFTILQNLLVKRRNKNVNIS